jgi:alanine dehydrogenase
VIVGIPTEVKDNEYRVAATPEGVRELVDAGQTVLIQEGAGLGSGLTEERYKRAGAQFVDAPEDVWREADLVLKVKEPQPHEYALMREGQILFTYLHLAANRELTEELMRRKVEAVAYETVQLADGRLPLLAPMSEIAGRMAPHEAARFLEKEQGGRGVLMGGVSGVRPAKVLVLGAGMAGTNAAWIAAGMEAEVIVVDKNLDRLRFIDQIHKGRIVTLMSDRLTLEQRVREADAVIGSVLVPGALAPRIVTEAMVASMRPGSVIVDIAAETGGNCALTEPGSVIDRGGVTIDGTLNLPSQLPFHASLLYANNVANLLLYMSNEGRVELDFEDEIVAGCCVTHEGRIVNDRVREAVEGAAARPGPPDSLANRAPLS